MIKKQMITILMVLLILTTLFAGCGSTNTQNNTTESSKENQLTTTPDERLDLEDIVVDYSSKDQDSTYDLSTSTTIILADNNTSISGEGASVNKNQISINDAGTYVVSGSLSDGQLIVDTTKVDTVQIVLDNTNITNITGSAFYVKQAEKVIITLAEDSINTMSDSSSYADTAENAPDAAIYSQDDLSINGSGTLIVNGNYKHGIKTVDDLVITNGDIIVTAIEEGLRGKDSISILDGNITITADGDGIKSNNDEEDTSGWVSIDGGTFEITAGNNGIQAQTSLLVSGGNLSITANEDALHSNE